MQRERFFPLLALCTDANNGRSFRLAPLVRESPDLALAARPEHKLDVDLDIFIRPDSNDLSTNDSVPE